MTATPGSGTQTAPEPRYVSRFGSTERVLHWVHAAAFFGLLGTGLVLYLPALAAHVGNRPVIKAIHLAVAVGWLTALTMIAIAGDRRTLRSTRREIERFDDDDLLWLRGRPAPQGRFNAGQKAHAILQAALGVLFTASGVLLWLGERNTTLRLPGTIALHDVATFVAAALLLGHLYLSLIAPATRPALRGITRGTVRADWARAHHSRWIPGPGPPRFMVSRRSVAVAALVALVGAATTAALVLDTLH